jgi:RNA polymerase sigma factor (sigma-70 family)
MGRHGGAVLRQLDRIFNRGTVAGLTEGQLLERFVAERDEAAFSALVTRHGPMVLGVCRRVLRSEHDVEDAFQATFLVLVRRANAVQRPDLLGNWLYGVAHRVAVRARANAARRHVHEQPIAEDVAEAVTPPCHNENRELRAVLEEELSRLPESLRAPLVLCYLDGLTHDEAARRLRWPVGTVRSRMARAREVLRRRLARRGMVATGAILTTLLAAESVPAALLSATIRASLIFAARQATAAGLASASATALATGVLHAMTLSKLKFLGAATLASVLAFGGVQAFAYQFGGLGQAGKSVEAEPKASERQAAVRLVQKLDKVQGELVESARRNAELQKEVQDLRAELEALRAGQPAAADKQAGAQESKKKAPTNPAPEAAADSKKKAPDDPGADAAVGAAPPRYIRVRNNLIMITSLEGDKVTLYNTETQKAKSIRLFGTKDAPLEVLAVSGGAPLGLGALIVSGSKVTRIATFSGDGTWYPLRLQEPLLNGRVSPVIHPGMVSYHLGRYYYLFRDFTKRWYVLEPPEGAPANAMAIINENTARVEYDGHIYDYDFTTSKWKHIDVRAILDAFDDEIQDGAEPKK